MINSLNVEANILNKNPNSLFDYEANDYLKSRITIKENGILSKCENKLKFIKEKDPIACLNSKYLYMAPIKRIQGKIIIDIDNYMLSFEIEKFKENIYKQNDEKIWLVLSKTYFPENQVNR